MLDMTVAANVDGHKFDVFAELPDGTYRFEDFIDNDGIVDTPIPVRLAITIAGDHMHFDFSGTGPKARGPLNMSRNTTLSSCFVAIKHIFPDVPVNGGTFRPISIHVPAGTLLAAEYPSPCGGYLDPMGRVIDVVFGALSQVLPDLLARRIMSPTPTTFKYADGRSPNDS